MRYQEILEAVDFSSLLNKVVRAIPDTVENFIQEKINEWSRIVMADRRKKAGYHPYSNTVTKDRDWNGKVTEYKPFDQETFDRFNKDWGVYSDGIGDALDKFIPYDVENQQSHIVYALMGKISAVLTKIVQEYVRSKYGDPVKLDKGKFLRNVDKIRILIWWKGNTDNYGGIYIRRSAHANGEETKLEIIVNRTKWTEWLREQIANELSGEGTNFEKFSKSVIRTFMHEYAHLEQDIKGSQGQLSLIPTAPTKITPGGRAKTTRRASYWDDPVGETNILRYFGKTEEIDANANGAAATVIDEISRDFRRWRGRYDANWTVDSVPTKDWNDAIKERLSLGDYGVPDRERSRYIDQIGDYIYRAKQLEKMSPEEKQREMSPEELHSLTLKEKFLTKVKQRFLKTYVLRLRSYLRTE